jgi:uncharacterized metal-binding protein YceD (DUF177 family)
MTPEFSRPVSLARFRQGGQEVHLRASEAECAALARRFAIPAVNRMAATLHLRPEPGGALLAEGRLEAEVVQDCVVTLEPVTQAVSEPVFLRILTDEGDFSDDPEGPDEILADGDVVELGEALAEQLSLALDPYPRAPGATLPAGEDAGGEDAPSGPFAGLTGLRGRR